MKIVVIVIIVVLVLVAGVASYGYRVARLAEAQYTGELHLDGLAAEVVVSFGPHAVPSIRAQSQDDLFFAQGYVMASERMWQMDIMRRLARGRLSAVLGEKGLTADRLFRTLGLGRAAARSLPALTANGRRVLEAFAGGVNAYRRAHQHRLPLEYRIAGFAPAPWEPVDSLAIGEYMAFILSFNAREELAFLRLAARVGTARAAELFPTDEGIPAPAYARELPAYGPRATDRADAGYAAPILSGLPLPGPASNSWAVAGWRTATGRPLLANDPHLSPSMPGVWYELELQAPGFHAAGLALPGVPLVVIGHNEHLAWGFTTSMADTQDLFVERLTPDGSSVERAGGPPEPVREREELIEIKGRERPLPWRVRETANGVVLNEVLGEPAAAHYGLVEVDTPHLLAMRWTFALADRSLDALYGINTASTTADLLAAARDFVHVSQNLIYAHADGAIGWYITGTLPLRSKGQGTFPVPGWTGEFGWRGYVAAGDNPRSADPAAGALWAANNRLVELDHPVHVTRSWMAPYRALRIEELLAAAPTVDAAAMRRMQLDRHSIEARRLRTALEAIATELSDHDPEAARIVDRHLRDWDGSFAAGSTAAALYLLLRQALYEEIYGDELGADLPVLTGIATVAYNALQETIRSGESTFWDDTRTAAVEEPAQIWARAIRRAFDRLGEHGDDPARVRLDQVRQLSFPHAFSMVPLLGRLFDVGPLAVGGDNFTLNVMKMDIERPAGLTFVPSYRVVFTPGDWRATRGTNTLGQSGHRLSPFRTDQLSDWLAGDTHRWPWNGPVETIGTLRLCSASDGDAVCRPRSR